VNLSSAVPTEHHQLTPRTPRTASGSRTSRLEQGFAKIRLTEANEADLDDDPSTLQSAPLLASSSTARFSARERRSSASPKESRRNQFAGSLRAAATIAPLALGILIGALLLFMLVLSLTRPGSLHRYLGVKPTPSSPGHDSSSTSMILPLQPIEYLKLCVKMHGGYVHHGDYWDINHDMGSDTHTTTNGSSTVCSKTITYILDGTVGLTADLALIAQAAALAREVQNQNLALVFRRLISPREIEHFSLMTLIGTEESQYEQNGTSYDNSHRIWMLDGQIISRT
jgi:hypothetical protein